LSWWLRVRLLPLRVAGPNQSSPTSGRRILCFRPNTAHLIRVSQLWCFPLPGHNLGPGSSCLFSWPSVCCHAYFPWCSQGPPVVSWFKAPNTSALCSLPRRGPQAQVANTCMLMWVGSEILYRSGAVVDLPCTWGSSSPARINTFTSAPLISTPQPHLARRKPIRGFLTVYLIRSMPSIDAPRDSAGQGPGACVFACHGPRFGRTPWREIQPRILVFGPKTCLLFNLDTHGAHARKTDRPPPLVAASSAPTMAFTSPPGHFFFLFSCFLFLLVPGPRSPLRVFATSRISTPTLV